MNWQDCKNMNDIRHYIEQAKPDDRIAQAWREMLEDNAQWRTGFELDDFIKIGYWRSEEMQAIADRLAVAVEGHKDEFGEIE